MPSPPESDPDPNTPTNPPANTTHSPSPTLLAVDLGLRTGLAVFGSDGRLIRYRSTHFPNVGALKRALPRVLLEAPNLACLVCEGDRHLASVWANRLRPTTELVWLAAHDWRPTLLTPSEQRDGPTAKDAADTKARATIIASGLSRPTSLRHDAAEAILIGVWGCLRLGWLTTPPWSLKHR